MIDPSGPGSVIPAGIRTGAITGDHSLAHVPVHAEVRLPGLPSL